MPDVDDLDNKKVISSTTITTTESLKTTKNKQQQIQQQQEQKQVDYSHKGENGHSKKIEELDREQQIILKENSRQNIIDFIVDNKDSIRVEDLKIYEPVCKCYRKKGHCHICNSLSNIICMSCSSHNYIKEEIWLCTNHWQQHEIEKHE